GIESAVLMTLASLSILLALGDIVAHFLARSFTDSPKRGLAFSAIASRLALAPAAARATVDACFPGAQGFTVTRKSTAPSIRPSDISLDHILLFAMAVPAVWAL